MIRQHCKINSNLFKLVNNSIFGKCLTNITHYSTRSILCVDKSKFLGYLSSPYFMDYVVINQNKIMVFMRKKKIKFNYPSYLGFSILQKSQRFMRHVYYSIFKSVLENNNLTLLYSDTDSFYISYNLILKKYTQECYF